MSCQNVIIIDSRLSAESFSISPCPFWRMLFDCMSATLWCGANDRNAEWMSACITSYTHDEHTRLFSKQLNAFRSERIRTVTAKFLLEVFLDCLETPAVKFAHVDRQF